jgi:hypothetical protein
MQSIYRMLMKPVTPAVQNVKVGSSSNNFTVSFAQLSSPHQKDQKNITNPLASELENFTSLFLRLLAPIAANPVEAVTFRLHTQMLLAIPLVALPPVIALWKL